LPLKQYVYRLVEVNRQTGEVTTLKELEGHRYATNWVMIRYFLNQYVMNRHLYSMEDIKRTFNIALAMSAKPIADAYEQQIIDTNPDSPLNVLSTNYYRDVEILGINQLSDNTALVRFKTITINKTTKSDKKTKDLQAVIKWQFIDTPASLKDRDDNPLGFFVTYYQESPVYADNN
jgi:type IV secretory pathway component VirB8